MTAAMENPASNLSSKRRRWPILVVVPVIVLTAITVASLVTYIGSRPAEPPPDTNGILYRHNPHGGRAPGGYGVASSNCSNPYSFTLGASVIGLESIANESLTVDLYLKQVTPPAPGTSEPSHIHFLRTLHLVDVPLGGTFTDENVTIRVLKFWRSSTTDDLRAYLQVTFHNA